MWEVEINCCCSICSGGMDSDPKDFGSGHLRPCELIQGGVPGQESIVSEEFSDGSHTWLWRQTGGMVGLEFS